MHLPSLESDYWELRSGEEAHREHPDTFWIPPLEQRQNINRGQAVRLIFDIESEDEDANITVQSERMWVIVSERHGGYYIGILDNQPASLDPANNNVYLCFGAEIPFLPEHVIDIANPPNQYVEWQLGQPPERRWTLK